MNLTESFSRNHVAVMAENKRKDLPSLFEEAFEAVLILPLPMTPQEQLLLPKTLFVLHNVHHVLTTQQASCKI